MIERATSYKAGDKIFATLGQAQAHELTALLEDVRPNTIDPKERDEVVAGVVSGLVHHADKVIDILSTNATSRPKGRRINGAKRTRKAQAPVTEGNGV